MIKKGGKLSNGRLEESGVCNWKRALSDPAFKKSFYLSLLTIVFLACFFPFYFAKIEDRNGHVLADALLNAIPAHDVSLLIFVLLYGGLIWMVYNLSGQPLTFLVVLWAYILLCVARILTITMIPLDPPVGLIELKDPMSILFYHTKSITKDLFFSGHTSTMFLLALFQHKTQHKIIGFALTLLMAILLLIQHVHYTVDILFAPVFSLLVWYIARVCCYNLCVVAGIKAENQ